MLSTCACACSALLPLLLLNVKLHTVWLLGETYMKHLKVFKLLAASILN